MKVRNSVAVATVALVLIPGAVLAGGHPGCSQPTRSTRAGALEVGSRELSYIDVSSDEDRGRGAVVTSAPGSGWSSDYRVPDPTPAFRWATRGEWRRHRWAAPSGSSTIPLT